MWISLSTSAGGSALGSSQPSCRPWERGDLLGRLSTFKPANWFGKPKAAGSLACARRGWVNVDGDKIQCESCGANLKYIAPDSLSPTQGEEFMDRLDDGHNVTCPWRGNSCAESLVQFPPTPLSALVGGYKDRCDGLAQFLFLPIVVASALDQMRVSRGPEIEQFLVQSCSFTVVESGFKADIASDVENNREVLCIYSRGRYAQKLISLCRWEPRWLPNVQDCEEHSAQSARNGFSFSPIKDQNPNKKPLSASTKKSSLKNEQSGPSSKFKRKKSPLLDCSLCGATVRILDFLNVVRPACFAPNSIDIPETSKKMALTRGISAASGISGWVAADIDESATTGVDSNLTMGDGFKSLIPERYQDANIGQPLGSEVGDLAASYESQGPSISKRNFDEGGSTVDRPQGVVIDRDGDEVNDSNRSKRAHDSHGFEPYEPSCRRDTLGAGPSQTLYFDIGRTSSAIAMDTLCHSADNDSTESVKNHPRYANEADLNEVSDLNVSNQAVRATAEIGVSSTNREDVLNKDGPSFGVSYGSVGIGASHEAEVHGADPLVRRSESVGDMEPVAEVTENQGQTGGFAADPGPTGESHDLMWRSAERANSGSKIVGSGSAKVESVEHGSHPSLSCNAVVCSGLEASKDEVTQERKSSPTNECGYPNDQLANGPLNGESNLEELMEFDPIKHHNFYCPWVNGNVAAARVSNSNGAGSSSTTLALCGWQLTLDALDGVQGPEPNQTIESESAASMYKDDHQISGQKLVARNSFNKSHGQN